MATRGIKDKIQETAMTDEEAVNLKAMFNEVGAQPKARLKEELQSWLLDYAASLKPEPPANTGTAVPQVITVCDPNHGLSSSVLVMICGGTNDGYDLWRHQAHSLIKEKCPEKDV